MALAKRMVCNITARLEEGFDKIPGMPRLSQPKHPLAAKAENRPSRVFGDNPALASFTITLILFSIQLFFIKPFFLVNDDIFKVLAVKGINASGQASPFIGYSNVLLGYFLRELYRWRQTFPWYGWFLCLTQFGALWAVLWLSLRKALVWGRVLLFTIAWVCVYFLFFVFLQFTITALLAAEAGLFIFLLSGRDGQEKPSNGSLVTGTVLLWLSALIRMDSLALAFVLALPLWISCLSDPQWREFIAKKKGFPILIGAGLLVLGLFHFFWFQNDPAWRQYRDFDQARVELQDYHVPFYTAQTKPVFDAAGWTENDLWLFKNWYYTDPAKFNLEAFRKIGASFPRWSSEGKTASFHSLEELVLSDWDLRMILALLILGLFCSSSARKFLLAQFLWTLLLFVGLIYLLRAPDRVTLPVLAFSLSWALVEGESFKTGRDLVSWGKGAVLAAALILCFPNLKGYYQQARQRQDAQQTLHDYLIDAQPRSDRLYVIWQFPLEGFGAFDDLECLRPFHLWISSFSQTSPASLNGLESFGVKEPLRDAVDNPRVLVICSTGEGLRYYQYVLENFHKKIYARLVFKCGAFSGFSIHSQNGS